VRLIRLPAALEAMLTLPLCAERRASYCYVRPALAKEFERTAQKMLGKHCDIFTGRELISKGFFGLRKPHPRLFERIGDYVLVMKENYLLYDKVMGEEKEFHVGNHGGLSAEEMHVPLVFLSNP
jgi:hypothetical protein